MNIGIDIDGVLTDIESFELEKGKDFFGMEAYNPAGYEIEDKFSVPLAWANIFWKGHILEYAEKFPARKNSALITNKLHEEGYKIFLITARCYSKHFDGVMNSDAMPKIVKKWLEDNNIYYDKIFFTGENKVEVVKKCKLSYMVEDSPKNIRELSEITPIIVFDAECNKNIEGNNIIHAKSWKEIYKIITNN